MADHQPRGRPVIAEPDFERLYDERAAYFLDQTGQRVVPDPRHLIRGEAQPTALVQRLLEGPSAALAAGVHNPLSVCSCALPSRSAGSRPPWT